MSEHSKQNNSAQNKIDDATYSAKKSRRNTQQIRTSILIGLQDCEFHSGEELAKIFKLSRSAISNHIKALSDLGLEIFSVKGRGYKLAHSIELLSHSMICQHLNNKTEKNKDLIQVKNLVSSTNDVVKQTLISGTQATSGFCCLAEAQSAGRGRRGRTWVSPYGSSLYLSMLWHFPSGYQVLSGLSLMVGVVVNRTLCDLGIIDCKLKWPNDLYYENKKLAGILIEVEGQIGAHATAIIGIGINLQLPNNVTGIDQAFTDVASISEKNISRNVMASKLIENLWQALPEFETAGLTSFLQEWKKADLYLDQKVNLVAGEQVTTGVSRGIDTNGALLLEVQTANGIQTKAFHGGEVSVRPV